ncbi:MAG: amidohydrolase family protein [Planctomycetota bacterium]|nr:amidohydrolase family protein [Planctomycetota bacterium]
MLKLLLAVVSGVCGLVFAQGPGPLQPPANGPRRADPAWTALANCTLHPAPGQTVPNATVVFRDGVVVAILPGADGQPARVPLGPRVIDSTDLHVYAAFIDPYVEVDAPAPAPGSPGVHWNAGVTPQRRALDGAGADAATAEALRKLGFGAAGIAPRGGTFRGTGALVSLAKAPDDPSVARPPVYRADIYQGVSFETARGGYPNSLMGAIALVRQTLADAAWLDALPEGAARAAALENEACLAFLSRSYDGVTPLLMDTADELDALRAAGVAKEFDRRAILLGSGTEFRRLEAIAAEKVPLFLPLNFPRTPDVGSLAKIDSTELRDLMTWEQAPTNPRRLAKAGVQFALTTARLRDRAQFTENLRKAIGAGLSPDQALAALTTTPAAMLLADGQLGTVEPGKRANLIVADGPLFEKKTRLRAVWIDGRPHELYTPGDDLSGEWTLDVPGAPEGKRKLVIEGTSITLHRDDASVKASRVSIEGGRVNFTFDHAPLGGREGVSAGSGVIERDAARRPVRLVGQGLHADGTSFVWSAARQPRSLAGLWPLVFERADAARPAPMLVFDDAGALTIVGADGSETPAPCQWDGATLRYDVPGVAGTRVEATPDFTDTPPTIAGAVVTPNARYPFTGTRAGVQGTWRVTKADAEIRNPDAEDALSIEIGKDSVTLTFTKPKGENAQRPKPTVIKGEDVKVEGRTVRFTHDLAPLGGAGKSTDVMRIFGDTLAGESTLPDGATHTYEAARRKKDDADDEDPMLKDIPESLPTPFGPYGSTQRPAQGTFVLRNGTVWTNTDRGILKNATVVVAAGKVVGIVEAGAPLPAVPADAVLIDCAGKHVTAGIIDAHSHTGISRGVNESGQAITAEVRIQDVTNPDTTNWYWQLAGGVTTVLNLHGSANAIGGQSQVNKVRWGAARPNDMHFEGAVAGIKFALGENPRGANSSSPREAGAGGGGARYPQTRMGVEMLIRDRFTAAREYAALRKSARPPRRDLELDALAEILEGTRLVHCHSYRQDEIVMLCHVAKEFGFKIGTFQHILEGYKVADYVRDHSGGGSGFADWWAYKVEVQDAIPQGLPLMQLVGATTSFNSDSDELARRLNVEAAKAVKYVGLPEEEAWKFVTLHPAQQLKIDSRVGAIRPGMDADLAVWSGPPMSTLSRCETTFVDGRRLFSLESDAAHREVIRAERSRLVQKILAERKKAGADDAPAAGAGEGPRRRQRPGGPPTDALSDEEAAAIREFYLDLEMRGKTPNQPGLCGCGFDHWE